MPNILFICTGNTCRSPMAEYLLRKMLRDRDVKEWKVKSAGISTIPGGNLSEGAAAVLKEEDIVVDDHTPKQVDEIMLKEADVVLTMTTAHKKKIKQIFNLSDNKLFTLKELIGEKNLDILDPFGQSLQIYKKTRDEIKNALDEMIGTLDQFKSKEGNKSRRKNNIIRSDMMKIAIGSDHAGYNLKEEIKNLLEEKGLTYRDMGTESTTSVDYPDFAHKVAAGVAKDDFDRGILICGTGIGMSIVANKVEGVRAALCHDVFSARAARNHNNANVLTMGSRIIGSELAREIVSTWLSSDFDGGRHKRRVTKITAIEKGEDLSE